MMGKETLKAEPTPTEQIPMSAGNRKALVVTGALIGGVVLVTAAVIVLIVARKKARPNGEA